MTEHRIVVDIGAALAALQASPELADAMNKALGLDDRFFLSRDNDLHWFVIPVARQQEWEEWLGIDSEDELAWTPPDFAEPVGGAPSRVTFTNPEVV